MTVLILYATIEGQTRKVAQFAEEQARELGFETKILDLSDKAVSISYDGVDKIVLAAPVHERRHPKPFEVFIAGESEALEKHRTLLISVSLSAAFPEGIEEAGEYVTEMKMRTGFTPNAELLVAGAVKTGSYDYFASQVVRHVVLRGRDYDPGEGEHEFTDWPMLASQLKDFLKG